MFLAMRIVNGIIATLACGIAILFLSSSGAYFLGFGTVVLLFVLDIFLRKRNERSDMIFSAIWSIIFAYVSTTGLQTLAYENISPDLGGYLVFGALVFLLYVLPLVLNGTYLARLAVQKKPSAD